MNYEIKWSGKAKSDYIDILLYINKEWSQREVEKFSSKVEKYLNSLIFTFLRRKEITRINALFLNRRHYITS